MKDFIVGDSFVEYEDDAVDNDKEMEIEEQEKTKNKKRDLNEVKPSLELEFENKRKLTEEEKSQFIDYYRKAKDCEEAGDFLLAREYYEKAIKIKPWSEAIQNKLSILRNVKKNEIDRYGFVFNPIKKVHQYQQLKLPEKIYNDLHTYQRYGVLWLYQNYMNRRGGILADEMGLGKTIQIAALLNSLYHEDLCRITIIACPLSVYIQWINELKKWAPKIRRISYRGDVKKRHQILESLEPTDQAIILTTYQTLSMDADYFVDLKDNNNINIDLMILDEGHLIKDYTSQRSQNLRKIACNCRFLLTGTPLQNYLKELWSLMTFISPTLFPEKQEFKTLYEIPITRAEDKNATERARIRGKEANERLNQLIKPFVLRRTKAETLKDNNNNNNNENINDLEFNNNNNNNEIIDNNDNDGISTASISKKTEFIIWIKLSEYQKKTYKDLLHSKLVEELISEHKQLAVITMLRKICNHTLTMGEKSIQSLGLENILYPQKENEKWSEYVERIGEENIQFLYEGSGKMMFLMNLLHKLINNNNNNKGEGEGHRCLIFCSSVKLLDIISYLLVHEKINHCRLDGSITSVEDRQEIMDKFNNSNYFKCCLLSTTCGGVGLNLTGADRVILYDPSWNPTQDDQALSRAYRIGQTKDVVVYRFITVGTVEEKMFAKQVFKGGLINTVVKVKYASKYFDHDETRRLFEYYDDDSVCKVCEDLTQLHGSIWDHYKDKRLILNNLKELMKFNICGISEHDLLFSKKLERKEEENEEDDDIMSGILSDINSNGQSSDRIFEFSNRKELLTEEEKEKRRKARYSRLRSNAYIIVDDNDNNNVVKKRSSIDNIIINNNNNNNNNNIVVDLSDDDEEEEEKEEEEEEEDSDIEIINEINPNRNSNRNSYNSKNNNSNSSPIQQQTPPPPTTTSSTSSIFNPYRPSILSTDYNYNNRYNNINTTPILSPQQQSPPNPPPYSVIKKISLSTKDDDDSSEFVDLSEIEADESIHNKYLNINNNNNDNNNNNNNNIDGENDDSFHTAVSSHSLEEREEREKVIENDNKEKELMEMEGSTILDEDLEDADIIKPLELEKEENSKEENNSIELDESPIKNEENNEMEESIQDNNNNINNYSPIVIDEYDDNNNADAFDIEDVYGSVINENEIIKNEENNQMKNEEKEEENVKSENISMNESGYEIVVCEDHKEKGLKKNIVVTHCRCFVNEEKMKEYEELIKIGKEKEDEINMCDDENDLKKIVLEILYIYLKAIDICDDDVSIHAAVKLLKGVANI